MIRKCKQKNRVFELYVFTQVDERKGNNLRKAEESDSIHVLHLFS